MGFHAITPDAPLDALIEMIWDCDLPLAEHRFDRMLASPNPSLIINLAEDTTRIYADDASLRCQVGPASTASGPYTHSFVIDAQEQQQVMGVQFRPGGALGFLHEPMHRLGNCDVDLEALAGPSAARLRQRLLETSQPRQRLALLEQWLRARARTTAPHPLVMYALDTLASAPQTARIGSIVSDCGVSPRRLGDLFREHVGISPKRHARLLRFRMVVDSGHDQQRLDWARVAADCGFHDQAHLTHEFRAFSGMTPAAWWASRGPHTNHVPLA